MIEFDYGTAEKIKQELQCVNEQYRAKVAELVQIEQALIDMWEGPARNAFHHNFLSDVEEMKAFAKLIDAYIYALDVIAINYRKADQYKIKSIWQSLQHDWEYALDGIRKAWDALQQDFSALVNNMKDTFSDMDRLKEALGLPKDFNWSTEEFLREMDEDKEAFINKWSALLNGDIGFTDGDFAPQLLEIAGYMFRMSPLCFLAYEMTDNSKLTNMIFDALDFDKDSDGIYHVNVHNWGDGDDFDLLQKLSHVMGNDDGFCFQQFGGYTDLYDTVFDVFCDMDANNDIVFSTVDGEEYTIWLWKGEYMNLGSGGECGLYAGNAHDRGKFGANFVECATDKEIPMSMTVDYGNGRSSIYDADSTWWATSFNPKERGISPNDISITYTLDFSEQPDMLKGLERAARDYNKDELEIDFSDKPKVRIKYLNENEKKK